MEIKQYVWDVVDSNSWLITEGTSGLLIDAVDNRQLYEQLETLDDLTVILTHSHFDHIVGLNRIRELKSQAKVIATKKCSEYVGNIYRNMSSSATAFMKFYEQGKKDNVEIDPIICEPADKHFEIGMVFEWCGHKVRLSAVYGHSDDSLLAIIDEKYMFSGDTLLHIPTITRFPTGSSRRFWLEDMPMLLVTKADKVFPGHGANGRLEDMMAVNKMPEKYKELNSK